MMLNHCIICVKRGGIPPKYGWIPDSIRLSKHLIRANTYGSTMWK